MAGFLVAAILGLIVVVPVLIFLANRVIWVGTEIRDYTADILVNGVALTGDLDPVPALGQTRDLVDQVTANAVRYVTALDRLS